jgi:hypothetical protein
MRLARIVLAASLLLVPLALLAGVPPGGQLKTPDDWRWRLDEPAAMSPGGKLEGSQWWFVAMPPGWHVTMGPGGLVYHPGYRASARFVVESELFLFPDSSDEGVGVFVGGQTLGDSEAPAYTALLLRKDGSASVVRRTGGSSKDLSAWGAVDGVKPHGGKDAEKHALRIEADTAAVTLLVDAVKVASLPRADVAPDGHFGFRIGKGVNIHVVRLDFTQQLAPPRPPKTAM